ncbi:MAG: class II aldolase/adducin family protein, partial [Bacteroidales bacterium]|nr:class II aldolase/adducin family protein [Bacteroidales bacterium]
MNKSEGYIKFDIKWKNKIIDIPTGIFLDINRWRNKLYKLNLIGAHDNKIGFGNISIREPNASSFFITGSASGNLQSLQKKHYARVINSNINSNLVYCEGLIKASSESLSHAVLYKSNHNINSIIHIHNYYLWKNFLHKYPTTSINSEFGTSALVKELETIIKSSDNSSGI